MSEMFQAFRENPAIRQRVSSALALSLVEELVLLDTERSRRGETPRTIPIPEEVLAESECGRTSLALWHYFGGDESGVQIVRTRASPALSHVMLREPGESGMVFDPTWKQFIRLAGARPSELATEELPDIAQFSSVSALQFAQEAALLAVRLRRDESTALGAMKQEELFRVYADIWNPEAMRSIEYNPNFRISFSAARIAQSMRGKLS
jgi:hypothetical protein